MFSRTLFFCLLSVSYTEIVNFIQGYVDNEINFNREDTCGKQCSDFKHVDYHICRNSTLCILNYLDKNKTRCDGDIRSCEFIESDMELCPNVSVAQKPLCFEYSTMVRNDLLINNILSSIVAAAAIFGKCFSRKMIKCRIVDIIIYDTIVVCNLVDHSSVHTN